MRHLLDVNVLLALADEAHVHRARVSQWYAGLLPGDVICTCATTELGLVRAMLNVGTQPNLPSALTAFSEL
jgi:predicted nucleic acid-binding protein